jgi:hypothetical protein
MFKACSTCKKPIAFNAKYYVCSVTTCQRKDTNFAFCTLDCWDAHVPTLRHKDAWGEERRAPATAEAPKPEAAAKVAAAPASDEDILIVASKLKAYIKAKSGMSTSAEVMDKLSDKVRAMADKAIHRAELASRKTVLDRDVE